VECGLAQRCEPACSAWAGTGRGAAQARGWPAGRAGDGGDGAAGGAGEPGLVRGLGGAREVRRGTANLVVVAVWRGGGRRWPTTCGRGGLARRRDAGAYTRSSATAEGVGRFAVARRWWISGREGRKLLGHDESSRGGRRVAGGELGWGKARLELQRARGGSGFGRSERRGVAELVHAQIDREEARRRRGEVRRGEPEEVEGRRSENTRRREVGSAAYLAGEVGGAAASRFVSLMPAGSFTVAGVWRRGEGVKVVVAALLLGRNRRGEGGNGEEREREGHGGVHRGGAVTGVGRRRRSSGAAWRARSASGSRGER